ncbi:protein TPX2 isoform X1 [Elaeis guineensis]|uniref:protein TPX2 isoform X1 n=1 Tax=Elaeis guineensis var. tenera TaxID=51953 RepID=UPI003C6D4794
MDDDEAMQAAFEEGVFLGCEIDLDYEFDAARYFDFGRAETPAEARAAELWFETAGSCPPSRLAHGCMLHRASKVSGKSTTKGPFSKASTLMKPTASQLAKQNQPREVKNACRSHKPAAVKSNRNFEDSSSYLHQAAKRQRLERGHLCKIVGAMPQLDLIHKVPKKKTGPAVCNTGLPRLKLTIPKEPKLETARRALNFRAQRVRPSNAKHLQEGMVPTTSAFKERPLNQKILEAPSVSLAQKSTPRLPSFKEFNLKTRNKTTQHCSATSSSTVSDSHIPSAVKGNVTGSKRTELQDSGAPKLPNDDEKAKDSRNMSCIFKARLWSKKVTSDFNLSTTKSCQQTALTELFNMLSLASEEQKTTASQTRCQLPTYVAAEVSIFLLQLILFFSLLFKCIH